ncbi:MAG: phage tail sheath family protein [Oscillospiraceae bacterium]|nr:phage tail sheath family protein [Oscillospiraceae bacterium]
MALGGGTFVTQNKVLPGPYINFVSAASASAALSKRGISTMPLALEWGPEGEVFEVTAGDFRKYSQKLFGYPYAHEKLKGLRDLFRNTRTLYAYRVGGGNKAKNTLAEAKNSGTRGNVITTAISANVDEPEKWDVRTYFAGELVDEQKAVETAADLKENDYVTFISGAELAADAGTPLSGGSDVAPTTEDYRAYLEIIEGYSYNAMGVAVEDDATKELFIAFNKRMRDERGVKFQLVVHKHPADYLGVVNVKNDTLGESKCGLVYWTTGVVAGTEANKSAQNKAYDGEFDVDVKLTQPQLEAAITNGEFVFHRVGSDIRVLADINSMVTVSDTLGEVFKENQTVRVIDQIANDIAVLFNTKYLGVVPNDNAGRISLWGDIVKHHEQLQDLRAIEGFEDSDVTVAQGDSRKSVIVSDAITVVNAMDKLYMTVTVQ